MSRKVTTAVQVVVVVFLLSAAAWSAEPQAEASTPNMFGLERPEDLATINGLSYPGLECTLSLEVDAGLLSMVRPVLEQLLQASAKMPQAPQGLGSAMGAIGPQMQPVLMELFESIEGFAVAILAPRDGEVNVPKVSSFYMQKAQSVGWKPFMRLNEKTGPSIAVFQLPAEVPEGGDPEPPRGFVVVLATPQQVIAGGMLGQLDLAKVMPLLMQAGMSTSGATVEEPAEPASAPE